MDKLKLSKELRLLEKFLKQNLNVDFINYPLCDEERLELLNWDTFESKKQIILPLLKGYQRLARIIPYFFHESIIDFIRAGFNSAVQIASLPRSVFLTKCQTIIPIQQSFAKLIYRNAVIERNCIALRHINLSQYNNPYLRKLPFKMKNASSRISNFIDYNDIRIEDSLGG
jgi:hypothetical protein